MLRLGSMLTDPCTSSETRAHSKVCRAVISLMCRHNIALGIKYRGPYPRANLCVSPCLSKVWHKGHVNHSWKISHLWRKNHFSHTLLGLIPISNNYKIHPIQIQYSQHAESPIGWEHPILIQYATSWKHAESDPWASNKMNDNNKACCSGIK